MKRTIYANIEGTLMEIIPIYDIKRDSGTRKKHPTARRDSFSYSDDETSSDDDSDTSYDSESEGSEAHKVFRTQGWEVSELKLCDENDNQVELFGQTKLAAILSLETRTPSVFFQDSAGSICRASPRLIDELHIDNENGAWISRRVYDSPSAEDEKLSTDLGRAILGSPISVCSVRHQGLSLEILLFVNESDRRLHLHELDNKTGQWRGMYHVAQK